MRKILALALIMAFFAGFILLSRKSASQANFLDFLPIGQESRNLLIPDVVPTQPLEILIRNSAGKKALRFSTTFYNQGQGPLEIFGHSNTMKKVTYASQYVYEEDGPGVYRDIGTFVYHPEHSHWHLDQYVFYQLWSTGPEGKADKLLVTTDKMSFCIWDEDPHDLNRDEAAKSRTYFRTCNGRQQGMSVGWSDTYAANVEGQEMDITNIGDGTYIFRTTINPDKKFLETDYNNNEVDIKIEIKGNTITKR